MAGFGGRSVPLTLMHLLLVEPLPIYTFYISYVDVLTSLVAFLETWYVTASDMPDAHKNETLGSWVACINDEVFAACFTMSTNFRGKCLPSDDGNYVGLANVGCLLVCCFVAACPIVVVALKGEVDVCRGGFLACKWEFEQSAFYHRAATLLLLYTCATGVFAVYETSTTLSSRVLTALAEAFLYYQLAGVLMLVTSAAALARAQDLNLDYRSEEFRKLRFRRTWKDVLLQSNSAFGLRLENAALLAKAGHTEELEAMLAHGSALEVAIRVCSRVESSDGAVGESDSEAGGSCSEESRDLAPLNR
mmetsp:Transcript_110424/g.330274  ORF Transcript_110424/g.330274 Transcript_110424/m.330274 type:complete len:305 (+) Transcript_110424:122-1036(+)